MITDQLGTIEDPADAVRLLNALRQHQQFRKRFKTIMVR
jgi:hypothetical protein